jgi:hypothetical protein
MADFSHVSITSPDQLLGLLKDEVAGTSTQWWAKNQSTVSGYLKALAAAAVETQASLLSGRIGEEQAAMILADQKAALEQTIQFTEYMTLALAQMLLDGIFGIIGWGIFNRTGINLFPDLVKPVA